MNKNIFLLFTFFSLAMSAFSQKDTTMSRTVVVENNYNPEIMDASKINVLPKVEELKARKNNIEYITEAAPFTSFNNIPLELQMVEPLSKKIKNGYVRAGYGNYSNTDFQAKYTLNFKQRDRLAFDAGLYGMNGKMNDWTGQDWKGRFFTTYISADYSHYFNEYILKFHGKYQSQVFNYISSAETDKQHNTITDFNASIASLTDNHIFQFMIQAGYSRFNQKYNLDLFKQGCENRFYINGDVWSKISEESKFGIDFKLNNISYTSSALKGFLSFRGNPYCSIENDDCMLRLGAHADYQTAMKKRVEFAPDVYAQYTVSDGYVIYAKADGGVTLNDFNRMSALSPYFIMNRQFVSTATPLNAKIGFKASPVNEMWFHLFAGYRINKNDLSYKIGHEPFYTDFYQDKSSALYAGGELRYDYKDLFSIQAKGVYYNWNTKADDKDMFLASKPEVVIDINLEYQIVPGLKVGCGYNFIKRNDDIADQADGYRYKYDNINNLHFGAKYEFIDNISIYANLNNVLNSENFHANCYPLEKFNFIGGLIFRF